MECAAFIYGLQRVSKILVKRGQMFFGAPGPAKQTFQFRGVDLAHHWITIFPFHVVAIAPVAEIFQVQFEKPAILQSQKSAERLHQARLSVGSQSHDLEFVTVAEKTQILRDSRVEDSQRMRKINPLDHLETAARAECHRGADE